MEKIDLLKTTFDRNTFIGFDLEEIKKTSSSDLLMIRKPIYAYLKSTKLKKRNANFIDVFKRINNELRERNIIPSKKPQQNFLLNVSKLTNSTKSGTSSERESITNETLTNEKIKNDNFLGKKYSIDISIPSFLNDKKHDLQYQMSSFPIDNRDKKLKSCNSNDNTDRDYFLKYDKPNFVPSIDDCLFHPYYKTEEPFFDIKEMELNSVIFNVVPEYAQFDLDDSYK